MMEVEREDDGLCISHCRGVIGKPAKGIEDRNLGRWWGLCWSSSKGDGRCQSCFMCTDVLRCASNILVSGLRLHCR